MKNTSETDISTLKEFTFGEDTLKQLSCAHAEKRIYVYERYNREGRLIAYEVVKGVRTKLPDGSIVYRYPSNEQFGSKGYYIAKNNKDDKIHGIEACIKSLITGNTINSFSPHWK